MKKALITLLLSTTLLFLVGCGNKSDQDNKNSVTSNGTTESSNSKTDTTNKDNNSDTNKKEDDTKKENTTNNKNNNSSSSNNNSASNSNTKKEDTKDISLTVFSPNSTGDGLNSKTVTINHLTAYSIMNALADNKVVPSGTTALKFDMSNGIGYLDVSSKIYNSDYGTTEEQLMLDSIRETFLKAFNINKLKLTVDGKPYMSSHLDYSSDDYL